MRSEKEERKYQELRASLQMVDVILGYITQLDQADNEEELEQILPGLLGSMGQYTLSDRSYIFEWADKNHNVLAMTHEWCAAGVRPTFGEMQHVAIADLPSWMKKFNKGEPIISHDWDSEKYTTPEEFAVFDGQDIHSLIVIPIFSNSKFNGYIGLDNPEQSMSAVSLRLLSAVGGHLGSLKENMIMVSELEENQQRLQKIIEEQRHQQKELEEALAAANLNNEIINSISKIYWLIYRMDLIKGTYDEVSAGQEVHRLTGKKGRTAEVFKEVRETVVSEEQQEMMEKFLDTSTLPERLQDTESVAIEYRARNGSWHLGRFIVKKRDANGRVTNVMYVVREIDKQKQLEIEYQKKLLETAEDARRANMAKTDFLRKMSHDIRTPINGIQGMIAIAEHYPDDPQKQKECRDKVKEASGFLLNLVNDILDMNKLESGSIVLDHKPFDLERVLQDANTITEMNCQRAGITLEIMERKVQHYHLIGSPLHLNQILQNIAGNAIKYNRKNGTVRIGIEEIESTDKEKAVFHFTCEDTGCGMSEEFIQTAFEPFTQERNDARTSYMGTGLGLAIVKQLVEMMDGEIQLQSKENVGTKFTITIPFELDKEYKEKNIKLNTRNDISMKGLKVLLAEDNALNLEIAQFLLEENGIQVTTATNGRQAADIFAGSEKGQFDLILMDIMMPVMDGLSAAREIRSMPREDAREIPIFAMTANAFREDIEQSLEAGMNEHLSKPLSEAKLMDIIGRYFG